MPIALSLILLLWALPSSASLGGDTASVQADAVRMQASVQSTPHSGYTLHEMASATGTTVREYVSSAGTVFAVAWKGAYPPNLRQLLGAQFDQYEQALKTAPGRPGHGPITIQLPNLIVQLGGHMGDYSGRAYLPEKVPASVSVESIR